jgi:hypothetical protein
MIKNILFILLFFSLGLNAQTNKNLSLRKIKKHYLYSFKTDLFDMYEFYNLPKNEFLKKANPLISIIVSSYPPQDSFYFPNVSVINLTEFNNILKFQNGFSDITRIVDTNNIQAVFIFYDYDYSDLRINLPIEFLKFKNLKYLNIDHNVNIPYWLTDLKKLEYLYIYNTHYDISKIYELYNYHFHYDDLDKYFIPLEIALLPKIKVVHLVSDNWEFNIPEFEFIEQIKPSLINFRGYNETRHDFIMPKLKFRKKIKDGNYVFYYPKTKDTAVVGNIVNGTLHGEFSLYYKNRQLAQKRYYNYGKYDSTWIAYNLEGIKVLENKHFGNNSILTYYLKSDTFQMLYENDILQKKIIKPKMELTKINNKNVSNYVIESYYNFFGLEDSIICTANINSEKVIIEKIIYDNIEGDIYKYHELYNEKGEFIKRVTTTNKEIGAHVLNPEKK